jgi:hypothetical protein
MYPSANVTYDVLSPANETSAAASLGKVLELVYSVDGVANVVLREHLKEQGLSKARTVLGSRVPQAWAYPPPPTSPPPPSPPPPPFPLPSPPPA